MSLKLVPITNVYIYNSFIVSPPHFVDFFLSFRVFLRPVRLFLGGIFHPDSRMFTYDPAVGRSRFNPPTWVRGVSASSSRNNRWIHLHWRLLNLNVLVVGAANATAGSPRRRRRLYNYIVIFVGFFFLGFFICTARPPLAAARSVFRSLIIIYTYHIV